jgi:hypothetical protein
VGEDVAPEEEVGGLAVGHEFIRGLHTEEFHDAGNLLLLPGDLGDVGRRLDAEDWDALGLEVLEEVAVVAGDLDHEARRIEAEACDHHFAVTARMFDPARRKAGEVGVVAENGVG